MKSSWARSCSKGPDPPGYDNPGVGASSCVGPTGYTPAVVSCPICGEENPGRAKFCLNCGRSLIESAGGAVEERKVVTVLFCDLVGFTARSDKADPEDVKAALRPFHSLIKGEIEAFGGTLDKFIGDAALGVFGSPTSHEDDPERAVRAALSIADRITASNDSDPSLSLAVRIGINTGEAVVAYGSGPQIGEAVTGDAVNTASRLQGVAPIGGIVVGESTLRATADIFDYETLAPVKVKGKADPIPMWLAIRAKGRFGSDFIRTHTTPFVGREQERRLLIDAYTRSVRDQSLQMLTIVGQPGAGKSRLVAELAHHLDRSGEPTTWRQGRCAAYGEGITFWALGEIVKTHARILESDTPQDAAAKLDEVIPEEVPDRLWLIQRLSPLVGAEGDSPADREQSFTAWRRFLELVASTAPAVFLFEDIHWADQAMLAFLEHLAASSRGFPMLVICTARPELYERYPGWADSADNASRTNLPPLTADQTSALLSAILDDATLPAEIQGLILERAGGNPLYAQEFVRLLRDRGLLGASGRAVTLPEGTEIPVPESIHSLIAARLDTVSPARKAVLQDASVIGRVFWLGALVDMGDRDEGSVLDILQNLTRSELVRPSGISSIESQSEYSFAHVLIRDVAYSQIPRASRVARHRAAAAWLEKVVGERVDDHAEVLAHHYTRALNLATAAGQTADAELLSGPALRFLLLAGDHALSLDVARAEAHYTRALSLARSGHPERPTVLVKWADAARQAGKAPLAAEALEEAVEIFRERKDHVAAGRAMGTLSSVLLNMGDPRQTEVARAAVGLLEAEPPGPDLVAAYARMAGVHIVLGDSRETLAWAERAIGLARDLDLEAPARVLGFRGYARCSLGDSEGLEDMRTALAQATERGEGRDAAVLYNNLSVALCPIERPASVLAIQREGIDFSKRRGITEFTVALGAASLDPLIDLGLWDEAMGLADRLTQKAEQTGDIADLIQIRWNQIRVLSARGEIEPARPWLEWLVEASRGSGGVEDLTAGFAAAASGYLAMREPERALVLLAELADLPHVADGPTYPVFLPEILRTAVSVGDVPLAQRLASGLEPVFAYREHALCAASAILAEALGETDRAILGYQEAADRWERFGVVPEQGYALLGWGRLALIHRTDEAREQLATARELFSGLGARPRVAEADALLAQAATLDP